MVKGRESRRGTVKGGESGREGLRV
jgi:hypothetical protein